MLNHEEFNFSHCLDDLNSEQRKDCLDALLVCAVDAKKEMAPECILKRFEENFNEFLDFVHRTKSTLLVFCDSYINELMVKMYALTQDNKEGLKDLLLSLLRAIDDVIREISEMKMFL